MVSWYYHFNKGCHDVNGVTSCVDDNGKKFNMSNFTTFVDSRAINVNPANLGNPDNVLDYRMSSEIERRYGTGDNVHCMMRTHNLRADFINCIERFTACGGSIKTETSLDELVDGALRVAAEQAHSAGRSVGDHPPCTELFDHAQLAELLKHEQTVIDTYKLDTCCSSDAKA
jgi:hypothetical protein